MSCITSWEDLAHSDPASEEQTRELANEWTYSTIQNKYLYTLSHNECCDVYWCWAHIITVTSPRRVLISVISTVSTFLLSSLLASCRVIGTRAGILVYPAGALFNQAINLISLVAVTKRFIGVLVAVIALPVLSSPLSWHRKLPLSSLSQAVV